MTLIFSYTEQNIYEPFPEGLKKSYYLNYDNNNYDLVTFSHTQNKISMRNYQLLVLRDVLWCKLKVTKCPGEPKTKLLYFANVSKFLIQLANCSMTKMLHVKLYLVHVDLALCIVHVYTNTLRSTLHGVQRTP